MQSNRSADDVRRVAKSAFQCVVLGLAVLGASACSKAPEPPEPVVGYAPPAAKKDLPPPQTALKHLSETVLSGQKVFTSAQGQTVIALEQAITGQVALLMQSDKDSNGALSAIEFQQALGADIAADVVRKLFARIDRNQDGQLQPGELRAYVEPGVRAADHNKDGYLDAGDISALRKPLQLDNKAGVN